MVRPILSAISRRPFLWVCVISCVVGLLLIAGTSSVLSGWWQDRQLSAGIEACEGEGPRKQQCFEELILSAAHAQGIGLAFDVLAELYARDREFANFCHGNMHELGAIAYDDFKQSKDFSPSSKMSYCGFGFYHGFLEAMLFDKGDLSGAERFCDWLDAKFREQIQGVSFACYHGIGHGVIDGNDPTRWGDVKRFVEPGLTLCRTLTDRGEHRERCASGVFNALALAYREPQYELANDTRDPYAFCRTQGETYLKRACYDQMNTYVFWAYPKFADALEIAATRSEEAFRDVAVSSVGGPQAQEALAGSVDLAAFINECSVFSTHLANMCAQGFASSLIEFGKPGEEYQRAIAACARTGERAPVCFNAVVHSVLDRLPPEAHEQMCTDIAALTSTTLAEDCWNIVRGKGGLVF